ncbi:macro domain-containing protein [Pseudidiomarina insulisalsae]|uniref:RNase III inhibitor n=1 Tax=Pseudidiomarina insulisalsae TaxID=575789 RepID=A0A432YPX1_9GAMM|nr:macro domain-containing protein [Pseudidiomarina insulisalsae]RUO63122.1 RNase III inhibitor [Pseudidiomarina insulisalsae]
MNYECVQGDITQQDDIDAIVNAANAQLKSGGGVAGAIHRAAGEQLEQATRSLAPIEPGEAVITKAFDLPNRYVIHCLGPVYGEDEPSDELLADCYRNALNVADEHELASIAFPALSTGAFGYPFADATRVALQTVKAHSSKLKHVETIRFVLFSDSDYEHYQKALSEHELI